MNPKQWTATRAMPHVGLAFRSRKIAGLLVSLLIAAPCALAAPPASEKENRQKEARPIKVLHEQDLRFGGIVVMDAATVTVPSTGLDILYDGAVPLGGRPGAAVFRLQGRPNRMVEVQIPASTFVRFGAGGLAEFDTFKAIPEFRTGFEDLGAGRIRVRLDRMGENRLFVGGRMKIARNTASGALAAPLAIHARYVSDFRRDEAGGDDDD